jgi:hypothetical protein
VVADAEVNEANQTTLGTERRSVVKKSLTGPTLLEMSGNPTYRELGSSDDNFRVADHMSGMWRPTLTSVSLR